MIFMHSPSGAYTNVVLPSVYVYVHARRAKLSVTHYVELPSESILCPMDVYLISYISSRQGIYYLVTFILVHLMLVIMCCMQNVLSSVMQFLFLSEINL